MSCSIMNGVVGARDPEFTKIFTESLSAEEFIKRCLPKDGDSWWYTSSSREGKDTWCQVRNVNGQLVVEIGEGAA